ncbi:Gfo/Idh/MocA family protein [Litchfieldia salsa]|uniref:Predicted dehydrogenase n=1 Tax=Litchfieldia salsa TaxID=930152 RepID=A0A1H0WRP3_9BACI|nr:Gfo/Idh/MocA family oxidoreductase [Litchfieldia salsa]SDP93377.1 Predicted dehydrogenase [Litchfieldia salsa]
MAKRFGWAYVGSGSIAQKTANQILSTGDHKIISVWSNRKENADKFAKKYNCLAFEKMEDAIQAQGVEGVYIATPHTAHFNNALLALKCKKPVLIEKTITVNATELKMLLEYGTKHNLYIGEAMWTKFNPLAKYINDYVKEGHIGDILEMDADFSVWSPIRKRVNRPELGGGALLDLGVYPITYSHMLLGKPSAIDAKTKLNKFGVDGDDKIKLMNQNGSVSSISTSIFKYRSIQANIIGTKGKIKVPNFFSGNKAVITSNGKKFVHKTERSSYTYQFNKVALDIRQGKLESEEVQHKDSLEIMEIMDECRKQFDVYYENDRV